jgi:hypothetical protein
MHMFYSQLDLTIAMEVGGVDGLNEINVNNGGDLTACG